MRIRRRGALGPLLLAVAAAAFRGSSPQWPPARPVSVRARPLQLAWLDKPLASGVDLVKQRESALVTWLDENGVYMSTMSTWGRAAHPLRVESDTVDDFEPSGRGLISRKDITQGEPLVQIPTKLVMTKAKAQEVLGESVVPEDMGEYIAIALLLVHERAKGAASFFAPYIDILPTAEEVGQSFVWSDDELALLEGSGLVDSTRSFQAKLRAEYENLRETVCKTDAGRSLAESLSFEAFEWAMSMLFSRGIDLREEQTLALVPYADLLNHSPYSTAYFMLNNIPFSKEKEVTLYADRNYARNDQVLISYGQKSNSELLLLYGFVIDRNLFDEVELTVSIGEDDVRFEEKAAFLRRQGLKTKMAFPLLIDRYSSELMQFLRLGCVGPEDGELQKLDYNEPISVENEILAYEALRDGCEAALARYPETEEEDAKLMENAGLFTMLGRRQRMAVKLRRNEKRILLRTIRICDGAVANLEGEPV